MRTRGAAVTGIRLTNENDAPCPYCGNGPVAREQHDGTFWVGCPDACAPGKPLRGVFDRELFAATEKWNHQADRLPPFISCSSCRGRLEPTETETRWRCATCLREVRVGPTRYTGV